jgi:holdfast attachment protein HfaA
MHMARIAYLAPFVAAAAIALGAGAADATEFGQPNASSMTASGASSAPFANDSTYAVGYGMMAGEENVAPSGSTRDASGNRVIVNGIMGNSNVNQTTDFNQTGVGVPGATATAIGNQLNVVVAGSWNTVIVDSKQINNGDQNANVDHNGKLNN